MASITFDTHRVFKELQDAGFDEAQAEAVVKALGETTDRDVVKPKDLEDFATKADLSALELRMTVRLTGVIIAMSGLTIAILKLFP